MQEAEDILDQPHEECGVVGIVSRPEAQMEIARTIFFSLYALQHRGQESAGICTTDGAQWHIHKDMGLVSQVFHENNLRPLRGHIGIGHNRYSTMGGNHLSNVQPYVIQTLYGPIGVAHNGNVTNAGKMRRDLMASGVGFVGSSDTEVITQFLARPVENERPDQEDVWVRRLTALMNAAEGAYSLVVITANAIYAMRDPWGFRPLCLGHVRADDGEVGAWLAVSESSALLTIGGKYLREVRPGEIVRIDTTGLKTVREPPSDGPKPALCIFEYVYFARPDTKLDDQTVHVVRQRIGRQLAREAPAEADVVLGVPDSSLPAAMAYAEEIGLPYTEGLIKNRYIGRTFIQPSQRMRKNAVRLKFNALRENLEGKRVILVDDSIVRGTTMGPLVRLIREGGKAAEVHVRITSPPVRFPCFMGVDLAEPKDLIAHRMSVEQIREHIGADSLAFLSLEGLHAAVDQGILRPSGHCDACFSGRYPVDVSAFLNGNGKNQLKATFDTEDGEE